MRRRGAERRRMQTVAEVEQQIFTVQQQLGRMRDNGADPELLRTWEETLSVLEQVRQVMKHAANSN